ncbi:hypothetical protein K438DRAFT_1765616 [Mycena galopus ATCC 62051]|nr:hypothetical protein K438DRAFT_1765616 [Mycena galopus ATCC 62051]
MGAGILGHGCGGSGGRDFRLRGWVIMIQGNGHAEYMGVIQYFCYGSHAQYCTTPKSPSTKPSLEILLGANRLNDGTFKAILYEREGGLAVTALRWLGIAASATWDVKLQNRTHVRGMGDPDTRRNDNLHWPAILLHIGIIYNIPRDPLLTQNTACDSLG